MYQSVKDNFMPFTEKYEGGAAIDYMFCDKEGRVGCAFGLDFDNNAGGKSTDIVRARQEGLPKALALTWLVRGTSRRATAAEITAAWETIKALGNPEGANGAGWYRPKTTLQLEASSMKARVITLVTANEFALKTGSPAFAAFDTWPADAQLALLGLGWNGPTHLLVSSQATLPNPAGFRAACAQLDFATAASLGEMTAAKSNPSVKRRSDAQQQLLLNAAQVQRNAGAGTYQLATLYWPRILP